MKEVIAIDLGGTHIRFARVRDGKIFDFIKKKTPSSKKLILKELINGIKSLQNQNTNGVGISCAGFIEDGLIKVSPNLPLKGVNLKKYVQRYFKLKVAVENDANCAALAEKHFGVKKKNFFVLTLGTGIGGGVIINSKLYKGKGLGGELGFIILNKGKSFEDLAASAAITKLIKQKFGVKFVPEDKFNDYLTMHGLKSRKILNEIAKYLGQGIASLISVFDPEIIILSGGMSELGNSFLTEVKKEVKKYNFLPRIPPIQWSKLRHAGVLGASILN